VLIFQTLFRKLVLVIQFLVGEPVFVIQLLAGELVLSTVSSLFIGHTLYVHIIIDFYLFVLHNLIMAHFGESARSLDVTTIGCSVVIV